MGDVSKNASRDSERRVVRSFRSEFGQFWEIQLSRTGNSCEKAGVDDQWKRFFGKKLTWR